MALFWIDAHIAGKVRRVQLELRRFRLRHATEMSPEMRAVDDLLMLLSYTSGVAVGFERLLTLLRLVPVIGLLVTIGLIPLNVDFGDAGLSRLAGWAQSSVGVVPVVVMLLNPPVVRFGFRWKRAVFMGGVVERRTRLDDRARYAGLGGANIYEMENRVFRDLGVRKKIEAPVDLLLSPAVYIALNSTVSFGVGLASFVIDPGGLEGGPGGVSVEAVSLAVMYWFVWEVVKRHRRRLAHGAAV